MAETASLIPELESVVQRGSPEKRGEMLDRVTKLFLDGAPQFNEDHIRLFDDVFGHLVKEIETRALVELSRRLAPVGNAPVEILRRLAKDDDISVAGPVLSQSPRLPESDILEVARSKGQAHLFAISGRAGLNERVTDVLVRRGDRDVVRNVAANPGAKLSESGYSDIVKRAQHDGVLAESVAQRPDIPDHLFRELLVRATEVVQRRLLATAKPETQAEIRRVLAKISSDVASAQGSPRDFAPALKDVREQHDADALTEAELSGYANEQRYEHTVCALSELCAVPIEAIDRMMSGDRADPILILCKAGGFSWNTARAIILARPGNRDKSAPALETALGNFEKLSVSTARRVVQFWQSGPGEIRQAS